MNELERLLRDLSLVLELCLASGEEEDLDQLVERFIERAISKLSVQNGVLFARTREGDPTETGLRAYPRRRATQLFGATFGPSLDAKAEARMRDGQARVLPLAESIGALVMKAPEDFAEVLSVPIRNLGVIEIYSTTAGSMNEHEGRVLSTLVGFLAARIRSVDRAAGLEVRATSAEHAEHAINDLLGSLPGAVFSIGPDGQLEFASRNARALFDLDFDAGRKSPRDRCIDRAESTRIEEQLKAAALARQREVVLRYRCQADSTPLRHRDVEERLSLSYDREGRLLRTISFAVDVTDERRAQRRMDELGIQRTAMARADALRVDTERALRAKTEFLNLLSHELRAPLFPIIALSDLLLRSDGPGEAEWREQLKMINGAGKQMLELVTDLLDISRVDAGRWRPTAAPVNVPHLVTMVQERAGAAAGQLEVMVRSEVGTTDVHTDRTGLERILQGLLTHALEIRASGPVQLESLVLEDRVRITVRVTAPPLAVVPDDPNDVFEPFWERGGEPRVDARGRGLALTVVKRLTVAVGGTVSASIDGARRTWVAELPAAHADPAARAARAFRAVVGSADLAVAFPAALVAQSLGADVRIVQSVAETVELFRQRAFELFLVDVRMPGLRLLEDLVRAERQAPGSSTRVVGMVRPGDPLALTGAALDDSLALPVTRAGLLPVLARL